MLRKVLLVAVSLAVVSCGEIPDGVQTSKALLVLSRSEISGNLYFIVRDVDTGCEYIARSDFMTPRLGSDGQPICRPPTLPRSPQERY